MILRLLLAEREDQATFDREAIKGRLHRLVLPTLG